MLTIKDFKKESKKIYVANFGDYNIEMLIVEPDEKHKKFLFIALRRRGEVVTSETQKIEYKGELKNGQINEILLKGLNIANKFYKDFIA